MVKCDKCGVETYMPFRCNYCGGYFCEQHRLPEFHDCKGKYQAAPPSSIRVGDYSATGGTYGSYSTSRVIRPYWFSRTELRDLAVGLAIITLIPLVRVWEAGLFSDPTIVAGYVVILVLAFILHEMAHKFMAQRLGMWAEFRLNMWGLILTIFSFLIVQAAGFPLMIIAPGAVMIAGMMNQKEFGRIAIAGPATNITEAILFAVVFLASPNGSIAELGYLGMTINSGLALFNLIPFGVFDGLKIFKWSWKAWLVAIAASGAIFLCTLLLLS